MINQTETKNYKAICDTIRIKLNLNDFKIIEDKFDSPVNKVLSYYGRGIATAYQGMTAEDKRLSHYKPKLLLINGMQHGGRNVYLQIDVSIPKLLYGNNLQEVCDQDFKQSVLKLQKVLIEMGISARPKILANAPIIRFHSCKNIILPRGLQHKWLSAMFLKFTLVLAPAADTRTTLMAVIALDFIIMNTKLPFMTK